MSRHLGPVAASLEDLRRHLAQKSSGTFFLVDVDDNVAAIVVGAGLIEAVTFQGRHGDFAVEMLKKVKSASCSFRLDPPRAAKESELSKRALRWLTGEASAGPLRARPAAALDRDPVDRDPVDRDPVDRSPADRYRGAVEAASFSYFGPIAGVVCEAAFAGSSDLNQVIDELAARLTPDEASAFRVAIARAIDQAPIADGAGTAEQVMRQRRVVEKIAFAFLGPIAGVVCETAFANGRDPMQVIDEVANNLPPAEAANFRSEVAREIGIN